MKLIIFIVSCFSILPGLHGQDVADPEDSSNPQDVDSAAQNALKALQSQQEENNVNSNLEKSPDEGENLELHISGLKTMEEEKKPTNTDDKNTPNLTELLSGIKKSEKKAPSLSRVEGEDLKALDSPFDKAEEGNGTPDSKSEKDEEKGSKSKEKLPVVAAENAEASRVMEGLDEDAITKDIEQLQKKLGILQENIDKVLLESDGKETLGKRRKREAGPKDEGKLPEIEDMSKTLENVLKTVDSIQKYLDSALSENEEAEEKDKEEDKAKNISKDEKKGEDTEKSGGKDYAVDEESSTEDKSSAEESKEESKESAGKKTPTEIKGKQSESGGRKRKDDRMKKAKKSKQETASKER